MLSSNVIKWFVYLLTGLVVQVCSMHVIGMGQAGNFQVSAAQVKHMHDKSLSVIVQTTENECVQSFNGNHSCNTCKCSHISVVPFALIGQITRNNFVVFFVKTIMPYPSVYLYPPFRPPII